MLDFFRGKRVLVTGHTGFKGVWLCRMLVNAGAEVTGYALAPVDEQQPLYNLSEIGNHIESVFSDIRDYESLYHTFSEFRPEIVFHLAAQPIVRESYNNPKYTYETNVMGTVNILECVRLFSCVESFVNITTDKVYRNIEVQKGYSENDELDGYDPYSNSKSCSELATASYRRSFPNIAAISTVRAGNVIGGGDYAKDRIIPDCIKAAREGRPIFLRNPYSVRPYQFVLEPLSAYLELAEKQYRHPLISGAYNVGPDESSCITTGELAEIFCKQWGKAVWQNIGEENAPHEAELLMLDHSKITSVLGWKPKWNIKTAVQKTCEWEKGLLGGEKIVEIMDRQIAIYYESSEKNS
ncbi:MAG: CDP-glucose 4,6-dehydratase [Clostridia bacterium]|nr:CDP-glucose 4,6-dehydratase [Clostridia bacterium]